MKHLGNVTEFTETLQETDRLTTGLRKIDTWLDFQRCLGTYFPDKEVWTKRVEKVSVHLNNRFKTIGGEAHYHRREIRLHTALFEMEQLRAELTETFFHELAHIVAFDLFKDRGHGRSWRWIFSQFDFVPTRCHGNGNAFRAHAAQRSEKAQASLDEFIGDK